MIHFETEPIYETRFQRRNHEHSRSKVNTKPSLVCQVHGDRSSSTRDTSIHAVRWCGTSVCRTKPTLNDSDVAVLKFLAAAELVEADLWGQYSELATNNPEFRRALQEIDGSMPNYVTGDFDDETSHAAFINAYLVAAGQDPINLDPFRTLASVSRRRQRHRAPHQSHKSDRGFELLPTIPQRGESRLRGHQKCKIPFGGMAICFFFAPMTFQSS